MEETRAFYRDVTKFPVETDPREWRHRTLFFRDPEDTIIEIYAEP
jgi:lactoylglutathione lyase